MKMTKAFPILALALVALATNLPAQTPAPAQTSKSAPPKSYDSEEAYEKAYIDAYKGTGHVNARPISVDTPEVDPLLLEDYALPLNVKIEFTVTTKGTVTKAVIKTDTDYLIAQSIMDAVSNWRFIPAMHNGKPVAERTLLTLQFTDDDTIPAPTPVAKPKKKKASKMTFTPLSVDLAAAAAAASK